MAYFSSVVDSCQTDALHNYHQPVIRRLAAAASCALFAMMIAGCTVSPAYVEEVSSVDYGVLGTFGVTAKQLDREYALPTDLNDWERTRDEICAEPNSDQYSFPGTMSELPDSETVSVGDRIWAAALIHACPDTLDDWEWPAEYRAALTAEDPSWDEFNDEQAPVPAPAADTPQGNDRAAYCNDGTVIYSPQAESACNRNGGLLYASQMTEKEFQELLGNGAVGSSNNGGSSNYGDPDWEMGVDGDGYAVRCADGQISYSGGISGACSGHGGVG